MMFFAVSRIFATVLLAAVTAPAALSQAAAAPANTESPEQTQIRKLETQWADAMVKRDQYAADLVLSPTYVDISGRGEVTTKNQQIARMFTKAYPVESYRETLTSIRVLGDTAIAQGTYVLRRNSGNGDQEEKGIFTHVYQRSRDSWQAINSQRTVLVAQAAPPVSAEDKHAKSGVLPFHVPFVGHKKKTESEPGSSVTTEEAVPAAGDTPSADPATAPTTPPADTSAPAQSPQLENPK